ncbi:hypothetical protein D9M70_639250 [compost metagenome]
MVGDTCPQNDRIDRLCYIVDSAQRQAAYFRFLIIETCREDDRHISQQAIILQAEADFIAIETWHHDIQQNQIR